MASHASDRTRLLVYRDTAPGLVVTILKRGRCGDEYHIATASRFHQLALLYAAIPLLAGVYDAYEVATHQLEQQRAINWLSILVPRMGLALILAIVVYGLFHLAGSILVKLHRISLSAQPTWQFITAKPGAAR